MISIVIPVYNGERYLAECIDSCLEQTYEDYEVVIVNDGSTDGTEQLILNYQKKYPDKIRSVYKSNGGTASALNEGIKCMKGDWFKWLSADDKFNDRHALKDMMRLISTIPQHQDYIFYTNFNIIDEDSKLVEPYDEPNRTVKIRDLRNVELMHNFYGNGSSSLIHRKLIDKVGLFDEELPYDEDLDYWIKTCIKYGYTLYHLPLRTLRYRVHKQSLTWVADPTENLKLVNQIRDRYRQYLTDEQRAYLKYLQGTIPLRRRLIPVKIRKKIVKLYKRGM